MKWTDVRIIAIELADTRPEVDPMTVRFPQLMQWILELPEFQDRPERCNEKILEAIQMAWMEEHE